MALDASLSCEPLQRRTNLALRCANGPGNLVFVEWLLLGGCRRDDSDDAFVERGR